MVPICDTVARFHRQFVRAIDNMKKGQSVNFWKELSNSTSAKEVISAFANKRGYGGERTLVRYSQAAAGFKEGLPCNVSSSKTGWSTDYIDKIHAWWEEAFPSEVGPVTQELATRVVPVRTEHEVPKEARTQQESYKETPHKRKIRELAGSLQREIGLPSILEIFELRTGRGGVDLVIGPEQVENHLYRGLRSHLQTGGFSEVLNEIDEWKKGTERYFVKCHDLFKSVRGEIPGDEVTIPLNDGEPKPGLIIDDFCRTICVDVVGKVTGHPPGLEYEMEHHFLCHNMWVLKYGAYGIYLGRTKEELENYQNIHKDIIEDIIGKYASKLITREIATRTEKLSKIHTQINRQLGIFRDMERVPGYCELC